MKKKYNMTIVVDERIALETGRLVNDHINGIGLIQPNAAKIAGQVAFWLRKLKPLYPSESSQSFLLTLNELAALYVGLAICNRYRDDSSKDHVVRTPPRIMRDWVNSFRYHSHSPHSSMISFELFMCAD